VRLPSAFGTAAAVGTSGQVGASVEAAADGWHRVRVVNMPLYTIVMLES
jgi:hypothetical protein